ncbi:tetratricopeptide repeat protein [Leptothoe sp. ISB3NOV94-8A]
MAQELFIGRRQEQEQFRQVLRLFQTSWATRQLPTVMKLMGKTASQPKQPAIFLFYGEGGMGKTTLVKELQRIAEQEPFGAEQLSRHQFQTVYIDWELHKNDPEIVVSHDQIQPEGVLAVLHRAVSTQFGELKAFTQALAEIQTFEQKVDEQLKQPPQAGQEALKQEILDLGAKGLAWAVKTAAATQTGPIAAALGGATVERLAKVGITLSAEGLSQINRLVSKALTTEEQEIYARPQKKLAVALGEGLAAAAKKRPLVIVLDTYEIVDTPLCDYALRQVIQASGGQTVWVIAGRANLADSGQRGQAYFRGYRQDFSDQAYAYPLREFGVDELQQFFARQVPERPIDDSQAEALSQFSRGIPFVINLAAELWAKGVAFDDMIAPPEDASLNSEAPQPAHYQIIRKMSERFLMHCLGAEHQDDRQAVSALAMMRRPEPNLLRAMLDVEQLNPRLQELRQRYSFILDEELQLDNKLKFFLGEYLLNPEQYSEPLVQTLNERAQTFLELRIEQTTQELTDRAEWLADEDIAQLLIDYAYQCFWQDSSVQDQAGWRNLIPWVVEGWEYNQRWTRQLLEVAVGFKRRFSTAEQQRLKRLQMGLAPQAEVEAEADLLEELEKWSKRNWLTGDGAEERQAILTLKRGRLLSRQEHYEQSLTLYLEAQRKIPDRAVMLTRKLSDDLENLGFQLDWKDGSMASEPAKQAFELATELNPDNSSAWYGLGAIQKNFKAYEQAIAAYEKAIELDPKFVYPHHGLGNVYRAQNNYEQAIAAYEKAIELDPKFAAPHHSLGNVYSDQNNYEQAIAAYEKAIELDPKAAYSHDGLGNVYSYQNNYEQAIAAYEKAIELDPKDAAPHDGLGNVYSDQNNYEQAIAAYEKAIELDPKFVYPHHGLGMVYSDQNNYEQAIAAYEKAIELDPKAAAPHNGLGWLYLIQDNLPTATDCFNQAIELNKKWGRPLCGLGLSFAIQGNLNRARELWKQALPLYTDDDDWDNAIIALYTVALGNPSQGLAALQTLIDKRAVPAALRNALEDAELLMKCPTPLKGIEDMIILLKNSLEES